MTTATPLHVVQISRDTALLRPTSDSEPRARQVAYARELHRRVPGARMTIAVLGKDGYGEGWTIDNLRVMSVHGPLRGALHLLPTLKALHRRMPISVLTTQVAYDEGWVALCFARWSRVPVIAQIHSDLFDEHTRMPGLIGVGRTLHDWVARRSLQAFTAVRTVSSDARASVARLSPRVALATIPVPVPMVSSQPRSAPEAKEPLVLYVGRLAPEKDLLTWLRVAAAVSQRHPEARFQIVGEGPERSRIEREAERLGLNHVLSMPGFVPYSRLRSLYARATALMLTSKAEGFGRVLVEAASQGTAAISTSLSGPRDIVINGVTGFLHEVGDVDGLARSVSTLIAHPQRAVDMGARAQMLVTLKFNPETLRERWVDLWVQTAQSVRCPA